VPRRSRTSAPDQRPASGRSANGRAVRAADQPSFLLAQAARGPGGDGRRRTVTEPARRAGQADHRCWFHAAPGRRISAAAGAGSEPARVCPHGDRLSAGALTPPLSRAIGTALPASGGSHYITITAAHRHLYWSVPATGCTTRWPAVPASARRCPRCPQAARASLAAAVAESSMLAARIEIFDPQQPRQPKPATSWHSRRPRTRPTRCWVRPVVRCFGA